MTLHPLLGLVSRQSTLWHQKLDASTERQALLSYVTTERDLYRTFSPLLKEAIPPFALAYAETPALAGVLAIADEDGQIEFVDTTKGNQRVESWNACFIKGMHQQPIYDVQWLNQDALIASAGGDGRVHIYDVATQRWRSSLGAHTNSLRSVRCHPDDPNLLVLSSRDSNVSFYDLRCAANATHVDTSQHDVTLDVAPSSTVGSTLPHLEYTKPAKCIITAHAYPEEAFAPAHHNSTKRRRMSQKGTPSRRQSGTLERKTNVSVTAAQWVPFLGERMVLTAGSNDGLLKCWDLRYMVKSAHSYFFTGSASADLSTAVPRSKGIVDVAIDAAHGLIYAANTEMQIFRFDSKRSALDGNVTFSERCFSTRSQKMSFYQRIRLSPGAGRHLITGTESGDIHVWDTIQPFLDQPVVTLRGASHATTALAFSPHEEQGGMYTFASASDDTSVRIWRADEQKADAVRDVMESENEVEREMQDLRAKQWFMRSDRTIGFRPLTSENDGIELESEPGSSEVITGYAHAASKGPTLPENVLTFRHAKPLDTTLWHQNSRLDWTLLETPSDEASTSSDAEEEEMTPSQTRSLPPVKVDLFRQMKKRNAEVPKSRTIRDFFKPVDINPHQTASAA